MDKRRVQYSKEFKLGVVKELDSGVKARELAVKYNISKSQIYKWRQKYSPLTSADFLPITTSIDVDAKIDIGSTYTLINSIKIHLKNGVIIELDGVHSISNITEIAKGLQI